MHLNLYKQQFAEYFDSPEAGEQIQAAIRLINDKVKRIFFVGNGGSNAICSHMMEDFAKIGGYPTFSFSDATLITCFANDYGYENAVVEWMRLHFGEDDLLVAISSSGESKNILNAADFARSKNGHLITLSGFKENNQLSQKGEINFHIGISNYGIVECYHQVILHIILDSLHEHK